MNQTMKPSDAYAILDNNYNCCENSFIYDLYEKKRFSRQLFWEYYDSIISLAEDALVNGRSIETARKLTFTYQHILKELLFHFDPSDSSVLKRLPRNYPKYIDRLDGALDAYFRGIFIDENLYDLQREPPSALHHHTHP